MGCLRKELERQHAGLQQYMVRYQCAMALNGVDIYPALCNEKCDF